MKTFPGLFFILSLFPAFFFSPLPAQGQSQPHISPSVAADYIHAVIEADRTIYSEFIVERLTETVNLPATENWQQDNTLLLPAQFLLNASRHVEKNESGLHYRLMSLWPINPDNGPSSENEKAGLGEVLKNSDRPFIWIGKFNGKTRFNAIYPDLAVTKSCAKCHNAHPNSPRKDFSKGDVMGGIHISFPVQQRTGDDKANSYTVAPEVVADYVHAILDADRSVYAGTVVNRLQNKGVIYATENWWEENTLLLPAQFLLNASELIRHRKPGLDFKLISLWPINPHNGAANEFESTGLKAVSDQPVRPYIGKVHIGNRDYFQAVYPDIANTPACVQCHNGHAKSPRHDFKLFDVIGGIVVSVPLGQD
ncbi:MAG: DUF3365 domain-containing protein [Candidatus Nitronauta litoralis]|uniref:DUF3365 domain-containing protein n=1 Tax=Candidatus Nitronauta litoralis TaxID=2705533 RepID=A0A7T0BYV4_9BACT|nr:MAG: DUF3365 domain-containing protein [Candidatus Nitronauta litoralis]